MLLFKECCKISNFIRISISLALSFKNVYEEKYKRLNDESIPEENAL